MMIALVCLVIMLSWLDRALRRGRIDLLMDETRHQLYTLRNDLRAAAASNEVDPHVWIFDYLDTSLTKTAALIKRVTVYEVLGFMIVSRNMVTMKQAYKALQRELGKPENVRFQQTYTQYQTC